MRLFGPLSQCKDPRESGAGALCRSECDPTARTPEARARTTKVTTHGLDYPISDDGCNQREGHDGDPRAAKRRGLD